MKLLIFGISGRTGRLVAEEAIRRGHSVIGIARDASKNPVTGAEIIQGTPYDYETVKKAIEGCNAVVSTLNIFPATQGLFSRLEKPHDIMSVSVGNAIRLMKEKGISRIVVMTSQGVGNSAGQIPLFFRILIKVSNIRYAYRDHAAQESLLEKSNLDWTVVRPVSLTDGTDNLSVINNLEGDRKVKSSVSRLAVACFILDSIEKGLFIRQKPGISNS